jgi:hypothetical protein
LELSNGDLRENVTGSELAALYLFGEQVRWVFPTLVISLSRSVYIASEWGIYSQRNAALHIVARGSKETILQKIFVTYLMILFVQSTCSAELHKHWRLAGSYSIPAFSDTRDLAGDAWGVGFDYSFLGPDDDNSMGGDISIAVDYKRFSRNQVSESFSLNRVLIGLKWRAGAGATCETEGLYGGLGVGLALINSVSSSAGVNVDNNRATLEWCVFGGANFARSWFIEAGYNSFGEFLDLNWGNADIRFGLRF